MSSTGWTLPDVRCVMSFTVHFRLGVNPTARDVVPPDLRAA
jgi:hypothetical protein